MITKTAKPKPKAKPKVAAEMTLPAMQAAVADLPPTMSTPDEIRARREARKANPKPKVEPKAKPAPKPVEPAKETPRNDHEFTPANLIAWREKLGLSQREAAKALGTARQSYSNYEAGKASIPKFIGLACQALASKTR
ncbi:helix-turn-helix transcriptional regulator [Mesorhizobium sp. M0152]|uniref:helix-turn-helix domain-containing protein n=1 Tax=Mesorhizobium sp. M0152 TaxID=2956898 RepID=UPI00333E0BF1